MTIISDQILRSRDNGTMGEAFTHPQTKRAAGDIIDQVTTDDALKVISQPSGPQLGDCSTYSYEEETAGRAMIYIVDGGANAQHIVSHQCKKSKPKSDVKSGDRNIPVSIRNPMGSGLVHHKKDLGLMRLMFTFGMFTMTG